MCIAHVRNQAISLDASNRVDVSRRRWKDPDRELTPPGFLQLAGHPLRWRLLGELARSDRMVHELTGLVGEPQNLVSYHLGKLRDARLVSARRSSADRRDAYYTVDLTRAGELLAATGGPCTRRSASPRRARTVRAGGGAGAGVVPVHGQQRPVADGRGACPGPLRWDWSRRTAPAAAPSRCTPTPCG